MLVTPSGSSILIKFIHSSNALAPILVNPSGNSILVKFVKRRNAKFPILVTPSSITTFFTKFLYTLLCHSVELFVSQSFIFPVPDIVKVPSSESLAITLPSPAFDISQILFSANIDILVCFLPFIKYLISVFSINTTAISTVIKINIINIYHFHFFIFVILPLIFYFYLFYYIYAYITSEKLLYYFFYCYGSNIFINNIKFILHFLFSLVSLFLL